MLCVCVSLVILNLKLSKTTRNQPSVHLNRLMKFKFHVQQRLHVYAHVHAIIQPTPLLVISIFGKISSIVGAGRCCLAPSRVDSLAGQPARRLARGHGILVPGTGKRQLSYG